MLKILKKKSKKIKIYLLRLVVQLFIFSHNAILRKKFSNLEIIKYTSIHNNITYKSDFFCLFKKTSLY